MTEYKSAMMRLDHGGTCVVCRAARGEELTREELLQVIVILDDALAGQETLTRVFADLADKRGKR